VYRSIPLDGRPQLASYILNTDEVRDGDVAVLEGKRLWDRQPDRE